MKKIFAIALAVVMVLSIASVAAAFTWSKPAEQNAETFASRYQIDVVKLVNETGIIGTNRMIENDSATAVNNAPVYFYIRLTVSGSNVASPDAIQENAKVDLSFTSLQNEGTAFAFRDETINIANLPNGTYYLNVTPGTDGWFKPLTYADMENSVLGDAVIEARCLDTATAKVAAKVYSKIDLWDTYPSIENALSVGGFKVVFNEDADAIGFFADDGTRIVTFFLNDDSLVTKADIYARSDNKLFELYRWLNNGDAQAIEAAINNKEMYMTDDNLLAAFGFNYSQSDSITWKANSTPIILDPTVSIPKTGDNASVIGFAMIMVAVVAAAVAVRKVNA